MITKSKLAEITVCINCDEQIMECEYCGLHIYNDERVLCKEEGAKHHICHICLEKLFMGVMKIENPN